MAIRFPKSPTINFSVLFLFYF